MSPIVVMPQHQRIVLLTNGYSTPFLAKTAINLLRYRNSAIAAVLESDTQAQTAQQLFGTGGDVPIIANLAQVADADAVYIGIAPPGGKLPAAWRPIVCDALRRGIDVVSGLHDFLTEDAEYQALSHQSGSLLIDVRRNRFKETGRGATFRAGCLRVHTVGHDCSIGKMVASLEVQRALSQQGHRAKFLATGQTGIMIEGSGVPIDCVVSDFVNGAAEQLVQSAEDYDFQMIEGQGCLTHPAYSAVTLGLLHGCAPHGLIFVYEAGREQVKGFDAIPIPPMRRIMDFCHMAANLRHPCRFIGIAINGRSITDEQAEAEVQRVEHEFGLPACDIYRHGPGKLVQASLDLRREVMGG